jgi:hypothetical protein
MSNMTTGVETKPQGIANHSPCVTVVKEPKTSSAASFTTDPFAGLPASTMPSRESYDDSGPAILPGESFADHVARTFTLPNCPFTKLKHLMGRHWMDSNITL